MHKFFVKIKSVEEMLVLLEQKLIRKLKRECQDFVYEDNNLMYNLESAFSESDVPFVFVIDEWGCVLRYYNYENQQKRYLDYLCALIKGKPYVVLAYMTGILPIKYNDENALVCVGTLAFYIA